MAYFISEVSRLYQEYVVDCEDKRTTHLPFMGSPWPVLSLIIVYLWFVLKAGPAFMKNRPPYNLDKIIQIYNIYQVVLCAYLTVVATKFYLNGEINFICGEVNLDDTPYQRCQLYKMYIYFFLKVLDLLDTVFFILRKKQSQVTFLHVYHHTAMVFGSWVWFKYVSGGHNAFLGAINSFVHAVMYAYYFITNYNKEYGKNLWWKKYITQLQMFQFFAIFLHSAIVLLQPNCGYPRPIIYLLVPQNLLIVVLFWNFYKKAYLSKPAGKTR